MWFKQKSKSGMQRTSISTGHNVPAKLMVNPLIVVNMGAEMVYILQQRLKAQNISDDKSSRVLADTVTALFEMTMVTKIFEPNNMWQSAIFRELFHNVTHSSIMRLNDQSMDKLYDLMIMGLKVQVIASRDPFELIESTLNHIDNITNIVESKVIDSYQVCELITSMRVRIIQTYTVLNYGKLLTIRNLLLQFLQDRRIKVSILLQKNLQANNGYVKIFTNGILPKYCEIPGKYQRQNGNQQIDEPNILLPNSSDCQINNINYTWEYGQLQTNIGNNLYANTDEKQQNNLAEGSQITTNQANGARSINSSNPGSAQVSRTNSIFQSPQRTRSGTIDPKARMSQQVAATNELNFLASMITTDMNNNNNNNNNNETSDNLSSQNITTNGKPDTQTKHSKLEFFDINFENDNNNNIELDFFGDSNQNKHNSNDNRDRNGSETNETGKSKKSKNNNDSNVMRFNKESKLNRLEKALNDLDLGDKNVSNRSASQSDFDESANVENDDLLALIDEMTDD